MVALIGATAAAAVAVFVPPSEQEFSSSLSHEMRVFANPQMWLALGIATLGGGAMFATFSYITPMMTHLAGYSKSSVTLLLVLFGAGMTVGNLAGGKLADWSLTKSLYIGLVSEMAVAVVFLATSHSKLGAAITIFVFPVTSLVMLPALQRRILALAAGAPTMAAASIQAAFNVANSIGAWLGGTVIAAGLGYDAPNAVAAGLGLRGPDVGDHVLAGGLPGQHPSGPSTAVQPAPI